jgi:hypothetical protein
MKIHVVLAMDVIIQRNKHYIILDNSVGASHSEASATQSELTKAAPTHIG